MNDNMKYLLLGAVVFVVSVFIGLKIWLFEDFEKLRGEVLE